jgi:hypothetical protein
MRARVAFALIVPVVMAGGCISVAGRTRPRWSPGWSTVKAAPSSSDSETDNVRIVAWIGDQRLDNAFVDATPVAPNERLEIVPGLTRADGEVVLSVPAGRWAIKVEQRGSFPVTRRLTIRRGASYVIETHTDRTAIPPPVVVF